MSKKRELFLSYSREDEDKALNIERALVRLGLGVWRDKRSISPGSRWPLAVETGIRGSRGVIVLITPKSVKSEWVTYEYAFATGAGVPVLAVVVPEVRVPDPVQHFQVLRYASARKMAAVIADGISRQSRDTGLKRASLPQLMAKFQEVNGTIVRASGGRVPSLWMDLWIEKAPPRCRSIFFEIMDQGFRDRKWKVTRKNGASRDVREFMTDDMNSYGDVEIGASATQPGGKSWTISSRLYEMLDRYYHGRTVNKDIRKALKQIRDN